MRSERFRYIRNYAPHRPWGQHYAYAWLSTAYQDYERQWLDRKLPEQKASSNLDFYTTEVQTAANKIQAAIGSY